jgi:hypothetical protein
VRASDGPTGEASNQRHWNAVNGVGAVRVNAATYLGLEGKAIRRRTTRGRCAESPLPRSKTAIALARSAEDEELLDQSFTGGYYFTAVNRPMR